MVEKQSQGDPITKAIVVQQAAMEKPKRKGSPVILALDYFVAGVPPFQYFEMKLEDLKTIIEKSATDAPLDPITELGLVGLAAYFEAFCKDLFSAAVNICPQLLENLVGVRDCQFTLGEVLHLVNGSQHRIGSVLAEHYDWGSARAVNSLFQDLLKISPFSKDEAKKYAEFLGDRNLLVHHGGVYTLQYAGQKFAKKSVKEIAHWDSLTVTKKDVSTWIGFLRGVATKGSLATHKAMTRFVKTNDIKLGKQRKRALGFLKPS